MYSYPHSFIDYQFDKFSPESRSWSSFLPLINNEQQYQLLHTKMCNQSRSQIISLSNDVTDPTPVLSKAQNTAKKLILHYKHERRFQSFKRDMHQLYTDIFNNTPAMEVKLLVGNCNRRNATHLLVRKKPALSILQDRAMPRMSKDISFTILYFIFKMVIFSILARLRKQKRANQQPTTTTNAQRQQRKF